VSDEHELPPDPDLERLKRSLERATLEGKHGSLLRTISGRTSCVGSTYGVRRAEE
jgi:hypothetical protein